MDAEKIPCPLVGVNGNVYAIISAVKRCLIEAGQLDEAMDWVAAAMASRSYDEVIQKTFDFVDPIGPGESS